LQQVSVGIWKVQYFCRISKYELAIPNDPEECCIWFRWTGGNELKKEG
jgi:hypothetical protein